MSEDIDLAGAGPKEIGVLKNLGMFYVYDFSEFTGFKCREDGLFGCRDEAFWGNEKNRFFLIRVDGKLAGFAVVDTTGMWPGADYDIAEFFVLRKFRRRGIGTNVAHTLFDAFPGRWQLRQVRENGPAQTFWRSVVFKYTSGQYEDSVERVGPSDEPQVIQRFSSSGGK